MLEGERRKIAIGTKVVVREKKAEGVIIRHATHGKWMEWAYHEVEYGRFGRRGWFQAEDLLVIDASTTEAK